MMFDHEKLDVYRVCIGYMRWAYQLCDRWKGSDRHARDQLLRDSQSIPLNIDVLFACQAIDAQVAQAGKASLLRIVVMLTKMAPVAPEIQEESEYEYEYECEYECEYEYDLPPRKQPSKAKL